MFGGGAVDVVQGEGLVACFERGEVVVWQVECDDASELREEVGLGFELAWEASEEAVLGVVELGFFDWSVGSDVFEFLESFDYGFFGHLGLHGAPCGEHGVVGAPGDVGVEAVAVAFVLSEVLVEARHEVAAEEVV